VYLSDQVVALGHDVTLFATGDSVTATRARSDLAKGPAARPVGAGLPCALRRAAQATVRVKKGPR
jgi:hypothetical protein